MRTISTLRNYTKLKIMFWKEYLAYFLQCGTKIKHSSAKKKT